MQRHETYKLFRLTEPHFAKAADKLYLRDISSAEWMAAHQNDEDVPEHDCIGEYIIIQLSIILTGIIGHVELPYYSKFLLIASFLASYNPPRMDTRYFARYSEQTDRRKRRKNAPVGRAKVVSKLNKNIKC